jgi:serine/threonine protein kinase
MSNSNADLRSGKVNAALADFLEAQERRVPWDRAAFLAQYPELADELSEFFADRDAMELVLGNSHASASIEAAGDTTLAGNGREAFSPNLPRRFGNFDLLEEIARGGMGVVYKARQITPQRVVAVKMILAGQLASADDVDRFYAEAQAAAMLDHPNIIPLFEVGQHEGQHYFSMGYVDGGSLAEQLSSSPLPPREAAVIIRTVSLAVHYAHQRGVIHRDLKPGNILVDARGLVRVSDFGLARRQFEASSLTATGQLLGTPSYMPPEQVSGQHDLIGPASDVYSLGATLYALITGRPPFQAASTIDTLRQVMEQDPVSPRRLDASLPRDLETITLKCLEKPPARRYSDAQALADELDRFIAGKPIRARRSTRAEQLFRWCQRARRRRHLERDNRLSGGRVAMAERRCSSATG